MMGKFSKVMTVIMGVAAVVTMGVAASMTPTFAANCPGDMKGTYEKSIAECGLKDENGNDKEQNGSLWNTMNTIINVALGLTGMVAVAMIIFGGYKMSTSGGAADKVKSGKDTIMYGVIGMIVALLAFAIVNFVLGSIFGDNSSSSSSSSSSSGNNSYASRDECEAAGLTWNSARRECN